MNHPVNQAFSGTCTGTFLVLFMQISFNDISKTILLATIGAIVSFLVSRLLNKLLEYFFRKH